MPKIIPEMQIFRAVMETIGRYGYSGATTRQIAEAAGVGEVTLFRKYGSKAALVQQTIAALVEASDFPAAIRYTGDVRADLERVLRAYRQSVISNTAFFLMLFAETKNSPGLMETYAQPLALYQAVSGLIGRYQAEGVLQPENPLHTAAALVGPLMYLSMVVRTGATEAMPELDLESYLEHFLAGRLSRGS